MIAVKYNETHEKIYQDVKDKLDEINYENKLRPSWARYQQVKLILTYSIYGYIFGLLPIYCIFAIGNLHILRLFTKYVYLIGIILFILYLYYSVHVFLTSRKIPDLSKEGYTDEQFMIYNLLCSSNDMKCEVTRNKKSIKIILEGAKEKYVRCCYTLPIQTYRINGTGKKVFFFDLEKKVIYAEKLPQYLRLSYVTKYHKSNDRMCSSGVNNDKENVR